MLSSFMRVRNDELLARALVEEALDPRDFNEILKRLEALRKRGDCSPGSKDDGLDFFMVWYFIRQERRRKDKEPPSQ